MAAMALDDLPGHREAQPGSTLALGGGEWEEDIILPFPVDPRAIVDDLDPPTQWLRTYPNDDATGLVLIKERKVAE